MDQIQKQWQKISPKDRKKIREIFKKLKDRNFQDLNRKKLKGYDYIYRVRVRSYRIIYFDDGKTTILLKYLKKRDERTYREI